MIKCKNLDLTLRTTSDVAIHRTADIIGERIRFCQRRPFGPPLEAVAKRSLTKADRSPNSPP
jgi:hypothetical protein